jgi:hypothetical protein
MQVAQTTSGCMCDDGVLFRLPACHQMAMRWLKVLTVLYMMVMDIASHLFDATPLNAR